MKNIRITAGLLVVLSGLMFFVERTGVMNLHPYAYGVAWLAAILAVLIRGVRKIPGWAWALLWSSSYLAARILLGGQILRAGGNIYLTVTELSVILTAAWLGHRLCSSLEEVESAINQFLLPPVDPRIKHLNDADADIEQEFVRSRRYNNLLSLLVIEPEPSSVEMSFQRLFQEALFQLKGRYAHVRLLQVIGREMRRSDLVLEQPEDNRVIVLLPDTSPREVDLLVDRIRRMMQERLGISVALGVASFPDQALTFGEMMRKAQHEIRQGHAGTDEQNGYPAVSPNEKLDGVKQPEAAVVKSNDGKDMH